MINAPQNLYTKINPSQYPGGSPKDRVDPGNHPLPWEGRMDAGAFLRTIRQILFHPGKSFSGPSRPTWKKGLAFALPASFFASFFLNMGNFLSGRITLNTFCAQSLTGALNLVLLLGLEALILHLFLWLPLKKLGPTVGAIFYSLAVFPLFALPFFGRQVGMIWNLVIMVAAIANLHAIHPRKVVWAMAAPFILAWLGALFLSL